MAQRPHPSLPIVWFLDAADLLDRGCTPMCIKLIVDAVAEWEADGEKTLQDLRDQVNEILENKCP